KMEKEIAEAIGIHLRDREFFLARERDIVKSLSGPAVGVPATQSVPAAQQPAPAAPVAPEASARTEVQNNVEQIHLASTMSFSDLYAVGALMADFSRKGLHVWDAGFFDALRNDSVFQRGLRVLMSRIAEGNRTKVEFANVLMRESVINPLNFTTVDEYRIVTLQGEKLRISAAAGVGAFMVHTHPMMTIDRVDSSTGRKFKIITPLTFLLTPAEDDLKNNFSGAIVSGSQVTGMFLVYFHFANEEDRNEYLEYVKAQKANKKLPSVSFLIEKGWADIYNITPSETGVRFKETTFNALVETYQLLRENGIMRQKLLTEISPAVRSEVREPADEDSDDTYENVLTLLLDTPALDLIKLRERGRSPLWEAQGINEFTHGLETIDAMLGNLNDLAARISQEKKLERQEALAKSSESLARDLLFGLTALEARLNFGRAMLKLRDRKERPVGTVLIQSLPTFRSIESVLSASNLRFTVTSQEADKQNALSQIRALRDHVMTTLNTFPAIQAETFEMEEKFYSGYEYYRFRNKNLKDLLEASRAIRRLAESDQGKLISLLGARNLTVEQLAEKTLEKIRELIDPLHSPYFNSNLQRELYREQHRDLGRSGGYGRYLVNIDTGLCSQLEREINDWEEILAKENEDVMYPIETPRDLKPDDDVRVFGMTVSVGDGQVDAQLSPGGVHMAQGYVLLAHDVTQFFMVKLDYHRSHFISLKMVTLPMFMDRIQRESDPNNIEFLEEDLGSLQQSIEKMIQDYEHDKDYAEQHLLNLLGIPEANPRLLRAVVYRLLVGSKAKGLFALADNVRWFSQRRLRDKLDKLAKDLETNYGLKNGEYSWPTYDQEMPKLIAKVQEMLKQTQQLLDQKTKELGGRSEVRQPEYGQMGRTKAESEEEKAWEELKHALTLAMKEMLTNAIRLSLTKVQRARDAKVKVSTQWRPKVRLLQGDNGLEIRILDTGPGFNIEQLRRAAQFYYRKFNGFTPADEKMLGGKWVTAVRKIAAQQTNRWSYFDTFLFQMPSFVGLMGRDPHVLAAKENIRIQLLRLKHVKERQYQKILKTHVPGTYAPEVIGQIKDLSNLILQNSAYYGQQADSVAKSLKKIASHLQQTFESYDREDSDEKLIYGDKSDPFLYVTSDMTKSLELTTGRGRALSSIFISKYGVFKTRNLRGKDGYGFEVIMLLRATDLVREQYENGHIGDLIRNMAKEMEQVFGIEIDLDLEPSSPTPQTTKPEFRENLSSVNAGHPARSEVRGVDERPDTAFGPVGRNRAEVRAVVAHVDLNNFLLHNGVGNLLGSYVSHHRATHKVPPRSIEEAAYDFMITRANFDRLQTVFRAMAHAYRRWGLKNRQLLDPTPSNLRGVADEIQQDLWGFMKREVMYEGRAYTSIEGIEDEIQAVIQKDVLHDESLSQVEESAIIDLIHALDEIDDILLAEVVLQLFLDSFSFYRKLFWINAYYERLRGSGILSEDRGVQMTITCDVRSDNVRIPIRVETKIGDEVLTLQELRPGDRDFDRRLNALLGLLQGLSAAKDGSADRLLRGFHQGIPDRTPQPHDAAPATKTTARSEVRESETSGRRSLGEILGEKLVGGESSIEAARILNEAIQDLISTRSFPQLGDRILLTADSAPKNQILLVYSIGSNGPFHEYVPVKKDAVSEAVNRIFDAELHHAFNGLIQGLLNDPDLLKDPMLKALVPVLKGPFMKLKKVFVSNHPVLISTRSDDEGKPVGVLIDRDRFRDHLEQKGQPGEVIALENLRSAIVKEAAVVKVVEEFPLMNKVFVQSGYELVRAFDYLKGLAQPSPHQLQEFYTLVRYRMGTWLHNEYLSLEYEIRYRAKKGVADAASHIPLANSLNPRLSRNYRSRIQSGFHDWATQEGPQYERDKKIRFLEVFDKNRRLHRVHRLAINNLKSAEEVFEKERVEKGVPCEIGPYFGQMRTKQFMEFLTDRRFNEGVTEAELEYLRTLARSEARPADNSAEVPEGSSAPNVAAAEAREAEIRVTDEVKTDQPSPTEIAIPEPKKPETVEAADVGYPDYLGDKGNPVVLFVGGALHPEKLQNLRPENFEPILVSAAEGIRSEIDSQIKALNQELRVGIQQLGTVQDLVDVFYSYDLEQMIQQRIQGKAIAGILDVSDLADLMRRTTAGVLLGIAEVTLGIGRAEVRHPNDAAWALFKVRRLISPQAVNGAFLKWCQRHQVSLKEGEQTLFDESKATFKVPLIIPAA
ncbi:MAG: ATP-binding protein, partial [Candidatus Omnitrophica bacterium]|nr:ATP-binding protein [Candidatus Omnitrophota bacterium]